VTQQIYDKAGENADTKYDDNNYSDDDNATKKERKIN